jgi:hypothetical protein
VGAVIAAVVNAFLRMYWLPSITGPVSDTQDGSPVFKLFYAWPDGRPVDAARMRANLELGGGFGRDRTPLEQLGKAEELIDRALAAHRKRRHQR